MPRPGNSDVSPGASQNREQRPSQPPPPSDVRMKGFARRATVEQAWHWLDQQLAPLSAETVPLRQAAHRVLAAEITSRSDVPSFERAMMDGYAVRSQDTLGATSYNQLELRVIGQVLPGEAPETSVERGTAVRIMTGAPIPPGADAVLPVEKTEVVSPREGPQDAQRIRIGDEVPPGKHLGRRGEDIAAGTAVLHPGRILRPQDLGILSSIGISEVCVVRRVRVRIVITGNELLPPGTQVTSQSEATHVVDANSPMLEALVSRDGGVPLHPGIIPDEPEAILAALQDDADVIIVSGGSSVGQEDHAPQLVDKHGQLAIHGIAMRPSSPAGMGRMQHRLVFLLPGNPVSCLCAYDFFAGRAIRSLAGRPRAWSYPQRTAPLIRKLVSAIGRVDYARVRFDADNGVEPIAISGASVLSSTSRADGFVVIPADSEGFPAGAMVDVFLYDNPYG